jgi:hypothetical protein
MSFDHIYPIAFEIEDNTELTRPASYIDQHLEIESEVRLSTKAYDKRDGLNFPIMNISFICSNIPAVWNYMDYISLSPSSRVCGSYHDFLDRGLLLMRKLLNQG